MLHNVAIGCGMIIATTVVHAAVMDVTVRGLEVVHADRWGKATRLSRVTVVGALALAMFLASLVEAGLWGLTYLALGAFDKVEEAMYFSGVTYTTLGFGDVTLDAGRRVLSTLEAANGILMFGWTTALLASCVQRVYYPQPPGGGERAKPDAPADEGTT